MPWKWALIHLLTPPPVARSCLRAPPDPHAPTTSHDEDWKPAHLAAMQVRTRFHATLVNIKGITRKFGVDLV